MPGDLDVATLDVSEDGAIALERLDGEADPAAALTQLLGHETAEHDSRLAEELGKLTNDRRLADTGPAFQQDLQRSDEGVSPGEL
jgi:hypothetical protein